MPVQCRQHYNMIFYLLSLATLAAARPSFIAVPADQIAFVDLSQVHIRVPRQTLSPPPPPQLPQALYDEEFQPIPQLPQQQIPIHFQQQPIALAPPPEPKLIPLRQLQQQDLLPQQQGLQPQFPHQLQFQNQAQLQSQPLVSQPQPQEADSAANQGQAARYSERPPDFGEYVDFGAHTGDNGAFGWYADYPINQYTNDHDHSGFRK